MIGVNNTITAGALLKCRYTARRSKESDTATLGLSICICSKWF